MIIGLRHLAIILPLAFDATPLAFRCFSADMLFAAFIAAATLPPAAAGRRC